MRHSEFWAAMEAAFGNRATSVAADLVLAALDHRSAEEALAAGVPPRQAWEAICDAQDLPDELRWHHRQEKPKRR